MRKIIAILLFVCSITWEACPQGQQQSASFGQTSIGGTFYLAPKLQMRFPAYKFNPPLVFDIGGSSSLQNIFQVVPLTTANTVNFRVVPPSGSRTITFADPGSSAGSVAYLDANSETFSGTGLTFTGSGLTINNGTNSQLAVQSGSNSYTLSFNAPSGARTLNVADPGSASATFMYTNGTNLQTVSNVNSFTGNKAMLTSSFTTGSSTTSLQAITGLSLNFPSSFVGNIAFHCAVNVSQATEVADQLGVAVLGVVSAIPLEGDHEGVRARSKYIGQKDRAGQTLGII